MLAVTALDSTGQDANESVNELGCVGAGVRPASPQKRQRKTTPDEQVASVVLEGQRQKAASASVEPAGPASVEMAVTTVLEECQRPAAGEAASASVEPAASIEMAVTTVLAGADRVAAGEAASALVETAPPASIEKAVTTVLVGADHASVEKAAPAPVPTAPFTPVEGPGPGLGTALSAVEVQHFVLPRTV